MAKAKSSENLATIQMALVGYNIEKERIEQKIRELNSLLAGSRTKSGSSKGAAQPRTKRELSSAARNRIAAAQRKRWIEYRKKKKTQAG